MRTVIQSGGRKQAWPVILFLILAVGLPHEARAHASLVRAQPAPGSTVRAPAQIDLWFNELLEDGFNSVAVIPTEELNLNPGEQFNLALGAPTVDPQDHTHLRVQVAPMPAGDYLVEWRVLSRDGHSATGRFSFRVVGSP
ncbi:MAG: yobA [Pedosphaera sp.]|nr:yobA [Pedosphaera sp.]